MVKGMILTIIGGQLCWLEHCTGRCAQCHLAGVGEVIYSWQALWKPSNVANAARPGSLWLSCPLYGHEADMCSVSPAPFKSELQDSIFNHFNPSCSGWQWFPTPGVCDSTATIFTTRMWKRIVLTLLHQISFCFVFLQWGRTELLINTPISNCMPKVFCT